MRRMFKTTANIRAELWYSTAGATDTKVADESFAKRPPLELKTV